jgi:hypothetical protein
MSQARLLPLCVQPASKQGHRVGVCQFGVGHLQGHSGSLSRKIVARQESVMRY